MSDRSKRTQRVLAYLRTKAERASVKTIADGLVIYAKSEIRDHNLLTPTIMGAALARAAATLLLDDFSPAEVAEKFRTMADDIAGAKK